MNNFPRSKKEWLKDNLDRMESNEHNQVFAIIKKHTDQFTKTQTGVLVSTDNLSSECLDEIEKYLDMTNEGPIESTSGTTEMKINIIKFEMVKLMLETVLSEHDDMDEKLGVKASNTSIPFKIAFNSLLNKKLINHY
jgi:hypothetical protein